MWVGRDRVRAAPIGSTQDREKAEGTSDLFEVRLYERLRRARRAAMDLSLSKPWPTRYR